MLETEKGNQTTITAFILVGFGNPHEPQPFLFLLFLMIYIVTITGNLLILALVVADRHLHTPMYFFLASLSCLETFYSSSILPKMLAGLLTGDRTITVSGCMAQSFFFGSCAAIETYMLAAMSYDRYLAICRPLNYVSVMHRRLCFQLIAGTWINGLIGNSILVYLMDQLYFCGPNVIDNFFCDLVPMKKLSCSDTYLIELITFILSFYFTLTPFLLTITSYVFIITTILKISSSTGRQKAFLTCSSHLTVVCIFYGSIIIVYMLPDTPTLRALNKVFSVCYTIVNPLINPLIYSLRNKEVHRALRMVCSRLAVYARNHLNCSLFLKCFQPIS